MTRRLSEAVTGRSDPRRAFQRYAVTLPVLVHPVDETKARCGSKATAVVTDISLSGLVFVSHRPHPPGSLVEIQIKLGAHSHCVQAVVKRSHLAVVVLPGRRVFHCAAQYVRGECTTRYIPALARHLYSHFGPNSADKGHL